MTMSDTDNTLLNVPSPCVRMCTLGDDDICVGCFRSLEEIKQWTQLSNVEKRQVVELADSRRLGARRA